MQMGIKFIWKITEFIIPEPFNHCFSPNGRSRLWICKIRSEKSIFFIWLREL